MCAPRRPWTASFPSLSPNLRMAAKKVNTLKACSKNVNDSTHILEGFLELTSISVENLCYHCSPTVIRPPPPSLSNPPFPRSSTEESSLPRGSLAFFLLLQGTEVEERRGDKKGRASFVDKEGRGSRHGTRKEGCVYLSGTNVHKPSRKSRLSSSAFFVFGVFLATLYVIFN